ncbi:MAG: hypothetical protein IJG68_06405 [Bacilli bacterium]|nr:hypothetical protein [Bacilli bacterium]
MKEINYLSSYLEGVLNMSSSISKSIGYSYVKVDGYLKESFQEEFKKFYHLKEDVRLIETTNSFEATLLDWFQNEDKIVESIHYWFHLKTKEEPKVFLTDIKLRDILDEKRMDFYSLEDLFFIECKNYIFVFLLGNNE